MFGRATIRLGIGPHSSYNCITNGTPLSVNNKSDLSSMCKICDVVKTVFDKRIAVLNIMLLLSHLLLNIIITVVVVVIIIIII